jgi:excisionase family DNA binding protein
MINSKLLYSVNETSKILNISSTKAYELIQQNKLPTIRLGKRILIPKHTLENCLVENLTVSK